jgi:hypothetical protein
LRQNNIAGAVLAADLQAFRTLNVATMAAPDLAALTDVKAWLAGSIGIGASNDALLARFVTDVSGAIAAYLGRAPADARPFH